MSAGRKNNSPTKHWNTPPKILAVVREFFGGRIDLDPCSNEHSLVDASVQYKLPEDGLALEWFGNVFCNPPYGRNPENKTSLLNWTNKAAESLAEIIMLIPVATNTRHFYRIWETAQCVCFLKDSRLKFWIDGKEDKKGAPMACCLVYWGSNSERFNKQFSSLGKCLIINPPCEKKV